MKGILPETQDIPPFQRFGKTIINRFIFSWARFCSHPANYVRLHKDNRLQTEKYG